MILARQLIVTVLFALLLSREVSAQLYTEPPLVTISTEETAYEQFEPITVEIGVENISSSVHQYGDIRWSTGLGYALHFELRRFESSRILKHKIFTVKEAIIGAQKTFLPGDKATTRFDLTLAYPIYQPDSYEIAIYYTDPTTFEAQQELASASFVVISSIATDSIAAILATEFEALMGLAETNLTDFDRIRANLQVVKTHPSSSARMVQTATFLIGLAFELEHIYQDTSISRAEIVYDAIGQDDPASPFNDIIEDGRANLWDGIPEDLHFEKAHISSLAAAITVRANVLEERVEPRFDGNSFLVDGNNYLLDGSETDGDVLGIVTDRLDSYDAIVVAVGGNQSDNIIGSSGFTSVEQQVLDVDVSSLVDFALTQTVVEVSGAVVGESYGSVENPVTLHAASDLTLDDVSGYGLLIVDGELTLTGASSWTGLVISTGDESSTAGLIMQGESRVLGAVYMEQTGSAAATLFVRGNAVVRYSSEAVEEMVRGALSN